MRVLRHNSAFCARAFLALALLAMALRAVVPQGFMLADAGQPGHLVSIRLCSGHGPVDALVDLNSGAIVQHGDHDGQGSKKAPQTDAPCVFAAVAHLAGPAAPLMHLVLMAAVSTAEFLNPIVAPGFGLAAPPPWSTGPPSRL